MSQKVVWDKGISYEEFKQWLTEQIVNRYPPKNKRDEVQFVYYSILAIQLANGLRISEAVEAFKKWVNGSERSFDVRVRKKRRVEEYVPTRIPNILEDEWKWVYREYAEIDDTTLIKRIKSWASKHKHNTHSVRYSWITYQLICGENPALVAKAVRHSKMDMILRYAQKLEADKLRFKDEW